MGLVFPAFFREHEKGSLGEAIQADGESTCFHHSDRKAVVICEGCGRFLCALCHVRMKDRDFCPVCVDAAVRKGSIADLDRQRVLHDRMLLALALYPVVIPIIIYITCLTAPAVLVMAVLWRNKPRSLVARSRVAYVVAVTLACLQVLVWLGLIVVLIDKANGGAS